MKKGYRILRWLALVLVLGAIFWLGVWTHGRRLIHGKTEAQWIRSLDGNANNWQPDLADWRALGPEGVRILGKALNQGSGPLHRGYNRFYNSNLGSVFEKILPEPRDSSNIRWNAAALLFRMGPGAKSAVPEMLRSLKNEEDENLRMEILAELNADMLRGLDKERAELLPLLIRDTHATGVLGLRINAVWDLEQYPEKRELVVPVLIDALKDTEVDVRGAAIAVLQKIAPDAAKPEIAGAIIKMLQNQEEISFLPGRVELLGDLGTNASAAVPALLEAIKGTNTALAEAATHALIKIDPQAAAGAGVK